MGNYFPEGAPESEPPTRKRAASTAQQSSKVKSQKALHAANMDENEDVEMEEAAPPPVAVRRRSRQAVAEPQQEEPQTNPKPVKPRPLYKTKPVPASEITAGDIADSAFADDAADSECEEQEADDEIFEEEEDLEGDDVAVSRKLADAVRVSVDVISTALTLLLKTPTWQNDDDDAQYQHNNGEEFFIEPRRSSSRASASSGHLSVPGSAYDDDSDSDWAEDDNVQVALKQAQNAAGRLSVPRKHVVESHSAMPRLDLEAMQSQRSRGHPPKSKGKGKRDTRRVEQEVPTFNEERDIARSSRDTSTLTPAGPKQASSTLPAQLAASASAKPVVAKPAVTKSTVTKPTAKPKPKPTPTAASTAPSTDSDCIDIIRDDQNKPGKKIQHLRVRRLLDTALEYFLALHLVRHAFPDAELRITFGQDSLTRAAEILGFEDIKTRIQVDDTYRETLISMRVSGFRGKIKTCAADALYMYWKVQQGSGDRTDLLLSNETFIYTHRPDTVDVATGRTIFGKSLPTKAFQNPGVAHVAGHFFRGSHALGPRITALMPRSTGGQPEMPRALLALACTAIYDALNDLKTGEQTGAYKASDFDANRVLSKYETYLALLEKLAGRPDKYSPIMVDILKATSSGSSRPIGDPEQHRVRQAALDMLDFSD
ncbi:hypothetical protein FB45DRAFT_882888 [Roridomyces roridus]|uniref:DUF6532 domain-containing protein n=1 Tax=Roridomyces roridus TaxID=1738132 RepID=A0AAD7AX53_9AGAR|nr:hypothetical protein FB45DRAFT_882888 [Roridomyces roridus]